MYRCVFGVVVSWHCLPQTVACRGRGGTTGLGYETRIRRGSYDFYWLKL